MPRNYYKWVDIIYSILLAVTLLVFFYALTYGSALRGLIILPYIVYMGLLVSPVVMWLTPAYSLLFILTASILAAAIGICMFLRRRSVRIFFLVSLIMFYYFASIFLFRFISTID